MPSGAARAPCAALEASGTPFGSLPGPQNGSTGLWEQNGGAASRRAAGRRGRGPAAQDAPRTASARRRRPAKGPPPRVRPRRTFPAYVPGVRPVRSGDRRGRRGAEGVGRSRGSPENMAWPGPRRSADPLYGPAGRQILWRHDQAEEELKGAENGPGRARRISGSNPSGPTAPAARDVSGAGAGAHPAITETIHYANGTHQSQPDREKPRETAARTGLNRRGNPARPGGNRDRHHQHRKTGESRETRSCARRKPGRVKPRRARLRGAGPPV